jgi:hypothetical protein
MAAIHKQYGGDFAQQEEREREREREKRQNTSASRADR